MNELLRKHVALRHLQSMPKHEAMCHAPLPTFLFNSNKILRSTLLINSLQSYLENKMQYFEFIIPELERESDGT